MGKSIFILHLFVAMQLCFLGYLSGSTLTVTMQDEWSLRISHPAAGDLCTNSRLTINEAATGNLIYYTRQMGAYWHENYPENLPGIARLHQYPDAKSTQFFRLEDYSARLSDDGQKVSIRMAGQMVDGAGGSAEYAVLCLPKYLADGASFDALTADGKKLEIKIPGQDGSSCLAENCSQIVFHLACGSLMIQVEKGEPLTVLDRRQTGYERGKCLFVGLSRWMSTKLDSMVTVSFEPDANVKYLEPLPAETGAEISVRPVVFRSAPHDVLIQSFCIVPKVLEWRGEATDPLTAAKQIRFPDMPEEDKRRLAKAAELLEPLPAILEMRLLTQEDGWNLPPDGFTVERNDGIILMKAASPRALFYGIQALRDLDLKQKFHLEDWPDLVFRGIHCVFPFETGQNVDEFFMREVWSRGRITHLVLQCQDTQWETTRKLWENRKDLPLSKESLRRIIQACRDNYIEPIPCIHLLSHCEWMFRGGHNLEFAENPERPYNYNVTDPRTFEFVDQLLTEVIDLFQPQYLHIAHDEVDCARTLAYPSRPENLPLGKSELFRRSVQHLHDFLGARGIQTMLWGDGLLSSVESGSGNAVVEHENVKSFRATLPKDLIIMHWEYSDGRKYEEIATLRDEGFQVVGCPWYHQGNIRNMTDAAKKYGVLGVLGTTWWPMYTWDYLCRSTYPPQLPAQLCTAALAWGPGDQEQVPMRRFADIVFGQISRKITLEKLPETSGFSLDLSPFANYYPQTDDQLLSGDFTSVCLPGAKLSVGRGEFILPSRNGRLAAVIMQSFPLAAGFPQSLAFPIAGQASRVHLLGGLIGQVPESHNQTEVFKLVFHYQDGSQAEVRAQYNYNFGHVRGEASYAINPAVAIESPDGARLWDNVFVNPNPGQPLSSLQIITSGHGCAIFGLSWETSVVSVAQ